MLYEFECPKGHVTEAIVPVGTRAWLCEACFAEHKATDGARLNANAIFVCHRILSATRTTFRFADRSATKSPRG